MVSDLDDFGNFPAVVTFVEFSKAFDSIHRQELMQILQVYRVPHIIVNAIKIPYGNTFAQVLSPDGITDDSRIISWYNTRRHTCP